MQILANYIYLFAAWFIIKYIAASSHGFVLNKPNPESARGLSKMSVKRKMHHFEECARISSHPTSLCPYLGSLNRKDTCKDFYMEILTNSLQSAYDKYGPSISYAADKFPCNDVKSVVIVGAGLTGLSAAFELEKEGYDIQILELQHRVGGRAKTLREEFSTGLVAEGGDTRIPLGHYLTNGYIEKFGIPVRPFISKNENAYFYINGADKIRIKDWESNNRMYSDLLFPGWNSNLDPLIQQDVNGILDLYSKTMQPVKDELYTLLDASGEQAGWEAWIQKWSTTTFGDFLMTNVYSETASCYRPWSENAVNGLKLAYGISDFNVNLVEMLRNTLTDWWTGKQKTPINGMDSIASEFTKRHESPSGKEIDLGRRIMFGTKVHRVTINDNSNVDVTYCNVHNGKDTTVTTDAVIITVPLPILRHMDIDFPANLKSVIDQVDAFPATKIIIQCQTRFWEKEVDQGGCTKTDLPICQLFYPSPNNLLPPTDKGLLVCYTFGQDAIEFGTQTKDAAVERAVSEIAKIHTEVKDQFEVGTVQAWFSDKAALSAYACVPPYMFWNGLNTLMTPNHPIYLAGDTISHTNGWIQGALESGLNAAYHLFSNDQRMK